MNELLRESVTPCRSCFFGSVLQWLNLILSLPVLHTCKRHDVNVNLYQVPQVLNYRVDDDHNS